MEEVNPNQLEENGSTEENENTELRIEQESQDLLNRVVGGQIETVKDRVAYILNNDTDSRNSDTILAWRYWQWFEGAGGSITLDQMLSFTKISSLARFRAKIQNEYKLFQADVAVRRYRGMLQDGIRQEQIEDRPSGAGLYSVYVDETGKTQNYLSVGSLWLLNFGLEYITKSNHIAEWKRSIGITSEFHFTRMSNSSLEAYKLFFAKFLSLFPEAGFKLIVVNNSGFPDVNSAITDLTFHLINKGVDHEHSSGRAPLPRVLQVWIDDEEIGSDRLKLENVKERIRGQQIEGLYVDEFKAVASKDNFFIQAVDLFTGAVNRKLHFPNGTHAKDELANYILNLVNLNIEEVNKANQQIDQSMVFNLSDYNVQAN